MPQHTMLPSPVCRSSPCTALLKLAQLIRYHARHTKFMLCAQVERFIMQAVMIAYKGRAVETALRRER